MSKIAFMFPGQGAQKAGMCKDFYEQSETARKVIDKATELLDIDMKALCFEENDKLDQTEYTQAALVTVCLAMEHVLRERGPGGKGSMAAVLGMTGEAIEKVVDEIDGVTIANYNCPGQIVITGWKESVEKASEALEEAGAKRVMPLNVSGPFHSPMLEEAGRELGQVLTNVKLSPLQVPYVTNVTAEYVTDISETKALLAKQVASSVRWQQSVENMIADGVDTFVEIGPGRTLAGFMRKINRDVKVYNVAVWEDVDKVVSELC